MKYLLTDRGRSELEALVKVHSLFAFDFDGTLAKIVRDRHSAQLGRPIRLWLGELAKRAPTAIISGRSVDDLRERVGNTVPYLIGNHGLEGLHVTQQVVEQARNTCKGWKQLIEERFGTKLTRYGVFVEDKSYSLSFHYRNSGRKDDARTLVFHVLAQLSPLPRIVLGKAVVNVVPASAPHKGAALLELMYQLNCTAALYIGDDDTDEDVFSLPDTRILTVRIGKKKISAARFFLKKQTEITEVLRSIVKTGDRNTCVRRGRNEPGHAQTATGAE
ncbi:MAG TPA: trehalose-phosphatase [Nitrospiraceae bacterium]